MITCKICEFSARNYEQLSQHFRRKHNISRDNYYSKFDPKNETVYRNLVAVRETWDKSKVLTCKICQHQAKNYGGLSAHLQKHKNEISSAEYYSKFDPELRPTLVDIENAVECKICSQKNKNFKGLASHLRFKHKKTPKEYYDEFLKNSNKEGSCLTCSNSTTFKSMTNGYSRFCCASCVMADPDVRLKQNTNRGDIWALKYAETRFNKVIYYQSALEKKFIDLCYDNNIDIENGDVIPYMWNNIKKFYHVDFKIWQNGKQRLIEIKDFHQWYYGDIESGLLEAKTNAADKWSEVHEYLPFTLLLKDIKIPV